MMKRFTDSLVVTVGLIASVVSIVAAPNWLRSWVALALGIAVLGLLALHFLARPRQPEFPLAEVEELCTQHEAVPATDKDITWIAELEARCFQHDAVPEHVLREWFRANPNGFFILKKGGRYIGHIDLLPIEPETLEGLRSGLLVERDVRGKCLIAPTDRDSITSLYVESLIIDVPYKHQRAIALRCLLTEFDNIIAHVCNPAGLQYFYAMAATKQGERLVTDLGFRVCRSSSDRKDGHSFFEIGYSELMSRITALARAEKRNSRHRTADIGLTATSEPAHG